MNSLEDLNNHSSVVTYSDDRPAAINFDRGVATNQTVNVLEGQSFTFPLGIDVTEIINYSTVGLSVSFSYQNLDTNDGEIVWPTLPAYISISHPNAYTYTFSGIRSVTDWDLIKDPQVNLLGSFNGTIATACTVTLTYFTSVTKSFTLTLNVANVVEWDTYTPDVYWFATGANTVENVPNLVDVSAPTPTWAVTITPSNTSLVSTMSSAGSGGSSSFNGTTKVLTINGTNVQINSHLNTLTFTTNGTVETNLTLSYRASSLSTSESDTTVQNLYAGRIRYLSLITDQSYDEDTNKSLTGAPSITDLEGTGGTYTVTVTASSTSAVRNMVTTGSGGSKSYASGILTIIGTKTQVNSHLSTITLTPGQDYASSFTLTYSINPPVTYTGNGSLSKVQNLTIGTAHNEISNITVTRNYINAQTNSIFSSSTPQITDLDASPGNYTISMSVPIGVGTFSAPGTATSRSWTYTGTKTAVNALFSQITFTPSTGYYANTTITYNQTKPGFNQVTNQSITLDGPDVAFDTINPANQTYTVAEGGTFSALVGRNIIGVNDYSTTLPTYTIDVSAVANTTVTWATVPTGCFVSNPSTGVYTINGITDSTIWATVKNPTITLPNGFSGGFYVYSAISWNSGSNSTQWNTNVTVTDEALLTAVTGFNIYSGRTYSVTGYPQIVDTGYQSPTYTITITPNDSVAITTISSSGSGGSSSLNGTTKVLTITGTKTQVNSHLSTLSVTIAGAYESDVLLTYYASTNVTPAETITRIQTLTKQTDVIFDAPDPTNQTVSTSEGATHSVPVGINLTFINANDSPLPKYTINVSSCSGATVTWATTPSGCTVTNPSTGVYVMSDISTTAQWATVKSPTVTLPNAFNGSFTYTATIGYNQSSTKSWNVVTTVSDVAALTSVSSFNYYSGTTQSITGYPTLVDPGSQSPTWTITLTPSRTTPITTISTSGSGGSSSFNGTSKVLTISGTVAQVNSHLSSMSITTPSGIDLSYTMTYYASNNLNAETATLVQNIASNNYTVLNYVRGSETYATNTSTSITNGPLITDTSANGLDYYTVAVTAESSSALGTLSGPAVYWSEIASFQEQFYSTGIYSYGCTLDISDNGNTIIAGIPDDGSGGTPIYIYKKTNNVWSSVDTINQGFFSQEGNNGISISGDGQRIAVGCPYYDNGTNVVGAVLIYKLTSGTWSQETIIYSDVQQIDGQFGYSIDLNYDGSTLAVTERFSNTSSRPYVHIYTRSGTTWSHQAKFTTQTGSTWNNFGNGLSLSNNGNKLLVSDLSSYYVYTRSGSTWSQTTSWTGIASALDMSDDGNTIVVRNDSSGGTYISIYVYSGGSWTLQQNLSDLPGSVTLSNNGNSLLVSGQLENEITIYFYKRTSGVWSLSYTFTSGSLCLLSEDETTFARFNNDGSGTLQKLHLYNPVSITWNSGTKTLTLYGDRTFCNNYIDQITYVPATGYTSDFELIYTATTPSSAQGKRNQTVTHV